MAGNGVSGGSVPAATWFGTMKPLKNGQPDTFFPPASPTYLTGSAATQLPAVIGRNVDDAKAALTAAGFTVTVAPRQNTGTAVNIVVDQSPRSAALPGSTVTLYISAGGA